MPLPQSEGNDHLSTTIVEAITSSSETTAAELPPLYDEIDVDALERLFTDRDVNGNVTFQYFDHIVTVSSDGSVEISDIAE